MGSEAYAQSGPVIREIRVVGSKRIAPETIKSYLTFNQGDRYDPYQANESIRALVATGLFENVNIQQNNGVVTVTVLNENPIINQVVFEGNKDIKDETLAPEVQLKPRSVFTRAKVQSDVQRILDVYRRSGYYAVQVDAQVIQLDNERVNLAFVIQEGPETKVLNITFIGNRAFSDSQLRSVITTTESNFLSFLKSTDVYDPDRLNLDRELLRRYYLKSGYADARVVSAVADLDREGKGFFITFTVEEGELYNFGKVDIESTLPSIDPASLRGEVLTHQGATYNAEYVDNTTEKLTIAVAEQGYAFGQIRPRVERDPISRTIGIVYVVEQGPRVYIERINIVGNARTRDYVIRRELRLAEGDAYNRLLVDQARVRLQKLAFFKSVKVNREPGSAPDRVVLNFVVEEQATGELSLAGGYSSSVGAIAEVAYTERNLLGKGQFLRVKLSGSLESGQIDLSFTEPRFLDQNISAGFDAFHKENDFSDESGYEQRKTGGSVRVGFALTDNVWLQPSYSLVQDEVFNVDDDASEAIKQVEGERLISSVGYSLTWDSRNNRLNPSKGAYFALTQELAGVGGDVNYIQTVAEARGYYPIYEGITLVGRLIGGHIAGFGGQDVVAVDAFFKGGETIRGFDTSGIGPRAQRTDGSGDFDAIGGNIFYAGTLEVRFPIPFLPEELGFSGAVFADAGSLFDSDFSGAVNNDDVLRSSVGASLLWNSPVGPLRADFAYVINKADLDEEEFFRFGATTKF
ncbi:MULTISPECIES: outer membrane protein assembly factor BamA [Rhodomicrobium]|uniref:outer membrane protein assembly factor BamA n=1 Tax=Rhodomicrobium TaxID=1068 RepID=UPI001FD89487|nr:MULTISPECIES: outer membrane protein assembly factor BamA [Rhodomicrobium]